jgi:hypothetical protein
VSGSLTARCSRAPDGLQPAGACPPRGRTRPGGDPELASAAMASGRRLAAARGAWICFQDEAGQSLRPPRSRTWSRRGRTPVVTVSGKGSGRVSIAGLVCLPAADRPSRQLPRPNRHDPRTRTAVIVSSRRQPFNLCSRSCAAGRPSRRRVGTDVPREAVRQAGPLRRRHRRVLRPHATRGWRLRR